MRLTVLLYDRIAKMPVDFVHRSEGFLRGFRPHSSLKVFFSDPPNFIQKSLTFAIYLEIRVKP
jgi:hypothetical protein